jgi:hypothetical protein
VFERVAVIVAVLFRGQRMIYSLDRLLVLFTPPKCASNTLHEILTKQSCMSVIGPQMDGGVDIHTTVLPWDVWSRRDSYTFAVSIRHPYTRAASLYGHYKQYWPAPHLSFVDFLRQLVLAPRWGFFNATITSMLTPVESPFDGRPPIQVSHYVRVESLSQDLRALGFDVPADLPKYNNSDNRGLDEFTPESKELVDLWSHYDFQRFGYQPVIPQLENSA